MSFKSAETKFVSILVFMIHASEYTNQLFIFERKTNMVINQIAKASFPSIVLKFMIPSEP